MGPPPAVVDQDIQIAVVVQVSEAGTAADPRLQARLPGEALVLAEHALPVLQQHVGLGVTKAELDLLHVVEHVSVDHQQILIPVVVKIQEPGAESQQKLIPSGHSGGGPLIGEQPVLVVAVESVGLHIVIGHDDIHQAVPVVVGRVGAHSRFGIGFFVIAGAGKQGHVFESTLAVVLIVEIPYRVVGDVEVHPAVIVEIGRHHPQALALRIEDAGRGGHVPEAAAAQVLVEPVGDAVVVARITVGSDVLQLAVGTGFEAGLQVVGHVEIQVTVIVHVEKGGAGAPVGTTDAGFGRNVAEGSVPVVAKERIGSEVGDVDVPVAVVVVIAHGNPHAVGTVSLQPRLGGHLLEPAVGQVAIERVANRPGGAGVGRKASVDQQNIQPPVVVVVEQGAS